MKTWRLHSRVLDGLTVLVLVVYSGWSLVWYEGYCVVKPPHEFWIVMMVVLVLRLFLAFTIKKRD